MRTLTREEQYDENSPRMKSFPSNIQYRDLEISAGYDPTTKTHNAYVVHDTCDVYISLRFEGPIEIRKMVEHLLEIIYWMEEQ